MPLNYRGDHFWMQKWASEFLCFLAPGNPRRVVLAERDHRHRNERARRHEPDGVVIVVDVHEMNGGTKTSSQPLSGFDRRPSHLGEIDRDENVSNIGLFHVFK